MLKVNMHFDHETKGCYVFKLDPGAPRACDAVYIRKDAFLGARTVPANITLTVEVR